MSIPNPSGGSYARHVFDIAGIPVYFSAWYLVMVWFVLLTAGSMETGLIWLAVVTVGVLVHELGHGLVSKRYGLGATITMHAFGGWCSHASAPTPGIAARVTAAGPGASFGLAAVGWGVALLLPSSAPWWLHSFAGATVTLNVLFGFLNLMPVQPLDGGQLTLLALRRWRPEQAEDLADRIGLGVGGLAAVGAILNGMIFFGFLFGMFAYQAYQRMNGGGFLDDQVMVARGRPVSAAPRGDSPQLAFPWRPTPIVQGLMGLYVAVYVVARVFLDPGVFQLLALTPSSLAQGHLWQIVSWAVVMDPERWQDLLLVIGGLYLFGPLLELDLGRRAFAVLYGVSALLLGLVAVLLGLALPGVFGGTWVAASGLVYMLLFAWAALQRDTTLDALFLVPLKTPVLAGIVLGLDTLSFLSGGDTAWHLHAAGAAIGWFAIDRRQSLPVLTRPEPSTKGRPQLRVVSNRDDDDWVH